MSQQLLRLPVPRAASFETFWAGPNAAVTRALQAFCLQEGDDQYLLIGPQASGKSHLAQACCRARWDAGSQATYLDLTQASLDELALIGSDPSALIVVDGLERLQPDQELVLLRLVDQVRAAGGKLLLCSRTWPDQMAIRTPDLCSRLQWGGMLELRRLTETELRDLLEHRARLLGVKLPLRVQDYLLKRIARDPGTLVEVLEQALELAVRSGRQMTVPLLRELLGRYA